MPGKTNTDLTIAGFARAGGVGVETIRYYQRRGLLQTPQRAKDSSHAGGIRRYGDADVSRLRFIRSSQAAGFTLEQIAELLELDAGKDRTRARELATERIQALDAKIAELQAARASLQHLARLCQRSTGSCPIIETFERG